MKSTKFKGAFAKRFTSEMELADGNNINLATTPLIHSDDVPERQPSGILENDATMIKCVVELQLEKDVAGEVDRDNNNFEDAEASTANYESSSSAVEAIVGIEESEVKLEGLSPGEEFSEWQSLLLPLKIIEVDDNVCV